ncbi:MAG: AsmA family protein, partial [Gammaproteobacteria bacterium]|nr:AsmA family protein [Gammaproteobacteria bacterium]
MGKALKWLFGLVGLLVVIVIAAIIILPMVIDPNDYKDEITAQVKKSTGRDLTIRDPMELSVFPNIAVRLGGVTVSNAPGFGADPFAEVEELDLRVAFMPILSGSLEIDTVVLRGMALNLARNKSGKSNWDDLTEGKEAAGPRDDDDDEDRGDVSIAIQGIIIDDASLVWDDRQAGTRYEVSDLNVETGSIGSGKTVPVNMSVTLSSSKPAQTFDIEMRADLTANGEMTRFDIEDLKATLAAAGEGLPAGGVDLEMTAGINYDSGAGTVAINDLKLEGAGVELSGALSGKNLNDKPDFSGKLSLAESNLRQLMALGGSAPDTADPDVLTRVSADFGIAASSTRAALKPFTVKLDDSTFSGDFQVTSFEGPGLR